MKKRMLALALVVMLLAGCGTPSVPDATEGQIQYDWMAGECPVTTRRTGLERGGLTHADAEVTAEGVYFIYDHPRWSAGKTPAAPVILYADHGGDSVIKLCGRADCPHNTEDCNAYIYEGSQITYCDGYLYAVSGNRSEEECKLVRMDPDGSNRVEVFDLMAFARENGGDYVDCSMMTDGYLLFSTYYWAKQDDGGFSGTWLEYYTYKLDGSMGEPKAVDSLGWFLYNCGDVILTYMNTVENGGEYGSYWDWDLEADTLTYLTDHPGVPGYFDEEKAIYFRDGAVRRLTYETQTEEILIDTGLEGKYFAHCFPDCLVVAASELYNNADMNLYIYNWAYELVDTVPIDYPWTGDVVSHAIIAETAERIILTDTSFNIPRYYVEKSELGTGNVKIHQFNMPDLEEELVYYAQESEDQEWFENG